MSIYTERIQFDFFIPTQVKLVLEKSVTDEIKNVKAFIKDRFINNNKAYLDKNKYSVSVDGFIFDNPIYDGQIQFQIRIVNGSNEDVTVKSLLSLK